MEERKVLWKPPADCVAMRQLTRLSFLNEAKNLRFAPCCEIRDSSAAPQNDIATQSHEEEVTGAWNLIPITECFVGLVAFDFISCGK